MDQTELLIDIVIIVTFAAFYTYLDKKYKWFRIEPLYTSSLFVNFLINLAVIVVFWMIFSLLGF